MKVILVNSILAMTLGLSACSKDSAGDVAKRDRDREREKAESLYSEYQVIEGSYWGKTQEGDASLQLKTAWSSPDGGNTSTAAIVGTFTFYPLMTMFGQDPLQITFSIEQGNYFQVSSNLTLSLNDGEKSTKMVCLKLESAGLDCIWYTSRGELKVRFQKNLTPQEPAVLRNQGVYTGTTAQFDITAKFQTVYAKNSNSKIAQSQLVAQFEFLEKMPGKTRSTSPAVVFRSVDGVYDFFKSSLLFTVDGDSQIIVNCKILNEASLKCAWN
jgi:hypothetical protein